MNADEKAIFDYLKAWPHTFISGKEIARKLGIKGRYEEDRFWAIPILAVMVNKKWLETDSMGYYRINSEDRKKEKKRHHVSPQIIRILKSSGKNFDSFIADDDEDELSLPSVLKPKKPNPSVSGGQSS